MFPITVVPNIWFGNVLYLHTLPVRFQMYLVFTQTMFLGTVKNIQKANIVLFTPLPLFYLCFLYLLPLSFPFYCLHLTTLLTKLYIFIHSSCIQYTLKKHWLKNLQLHGNSVQTAFINFTLIFFSTNNFTAWTFITGSVSFKVTWMFMYKLFLLNSILTWCVSKCVSPNSSVIWIWTVLKCTMRNPSKYFKSDVTS